MNTPLSNPPRPAPAVIQQVALIMLALCLLVPGALYVGAQRSTQRVHEPLETRAAIDVLLGAIVPSGDPAAAPTPDAATLAGLLPQCSGLPDYQGLPVMDDLAEQMHLLDQQLERLTAIPGLRNAPLRQRYRLDAGAWARAVSSGKVACAQAVRSLRLLAAPEGATLLTQAQWREFRPAGAQRQTTAVQLATNSLAQTDPWRGWPGCIWLGGLSPGAPAYYLAPLGRATWGRPLCEQPGPMPGGAGAAVPARPMTATTIASADDPAWAVPHDVGLLIGELDALRLPQGRLYQDYVDQLPAKANRRTIGRNEVDVGFNVQLTIDPRTQAIAQRVAACYTGQAGACAQAGIGFDRVGAAQGKRGAAAMWERAATRVTAVAVIDVASGRIEALASAHTPCYAQENDGPARDAGCLPLWTEPRRRPDALLNHAAFGDFQPGSTIKPILASVFFEDRASNPDQLRSWLASSNTDRFNDELFCINAGGGRSCDRPARVQQRAADLGWNSDCTALPSRRCARSDILFGRRLSARLDLPEDAADSMPEAPPLQRSVLIGRLFAGPVDSGSSSGEKLMRLPPVDRGAALSCRDAGGGWRASNCNSAALKPLINEAAGQGQARTTALGLATMLARLAGAANGLAAVPAPHLVERITDATGAVVATAATRSAGAASAPLVRAEPSVVRPAVAQQVLAGMARGSAPAGTGHLVCRHVFGERCAALGAQLAGKTGTPSFGFDTLTLAQARRRCRANPRDEDCQQRPVKLYVAAVKSGADKSAAYDKVIAVISERNWYLADRKLGPAQRDRVHGATNDLDNIAAEIAMRVVAQAWVAPAAKR